MRFQLSLFVAAFLLATAVTATARSIASVESTACSVCPPGYECRCDVGAKDATNTHGFLKLSTVLRSNAEAETCVSSAKSLTQQGNSALFLATSPAGRTCGEAAKCGEVSKKTCERESVEYDDSTKRCCTAKQREECTVRHQEICEGQGSQGCKAVARRGCDEIRQLHCRYETERICVPPCPGSRRVCEADSEEVCVHKACHNSGPCLEAASCKQQPTKTCRTQGATTCRGSECRDEMVYRCDIVIIVVCEGEPVDDCGTVGDPVCRTEPVQTCAITEENIGCTQVAAKELCQVTKTENCNEEVERVCTEGAEKCTSQESVPCGSTVCANNATCMKTKQYVLNCLGTNGNCACCEEG